MQENNKKFTVLGLDLSLTSTGIVVLDQSGEVLHHEVAGEELVKATPSQKQKRVRKIASRVMLVQAKYNPKRVVIEDYGYSTMKGGTSSITQLAELCGVIKMFLHMKGVDPVVMSASQARKITLGTGVGVTSAERRKKMTVKDKVAVMVVSQYGKKFEINDETDAFVLAEAGRKILAGEPLPVDVMESLYKSRERKPKKRKVKRGK